MSFAKILAATALLCTFAQTIRGFSNEYFEDLEPSTHFFLSRNIDQSLMYASCKWIEDQRGFSCWIKLKTLNGEDRFCNAMLPVPRNTVDHLVSFKRSHLHNVYARSKAMLVWSLAGIPGTKDHRYISLVDMNDCSSVHLDVPLDVRPRDIVHDRRNQPNEHVLLFDDGFLVYAHSQDKCGDTFCILRFNYDGEGVGEPVPIAFKYYINRHSMAVDGRNSSSGGYFIASGLPRYDNILINVSRVSYDGSEEVFVENHPIELDPHMMAVVQSSENGYYSLCHTVEWNNGTVRCVQYNGSGRKMMDSRIDLMGKEQKMVGVFNRRRGGVVLVYLVGCRNSQQSCFNVSVGVKVVDADGRVSRESGVAGVKLDHRTPTQKRISIDHVETDAEHCFYFGYLQKLARGRGAVKYFNRCANKAASSWQL